MKTAGLLMLLSGVLLIARGGRQRSAAWLLLGVVQTASGVVVFWAGARQ